MRRGRAVERFEQCRVIAQRLPPQLGRRLVEVAPAQLEHRGAGPRIDPGGGIGHQPHHHRLDRDRLDLGLRQTCRKGRVGDQWFARHGDPTCCLAYRTQLRRNTQRGCGPDHAFAIEQDLAIAPAHSLFADEVLNRHPDVIEKHLVRVMLLVERDDGPNSDTRRGDVDEQQRNACLLARLRRCPHEAEHHCRDMGVARPHLLAVEDIMVAVADRAGGQAREVGPGSRLRIALAPPVLARHDARQVMRLLFG